MPIDPRLTRHRWIADYLMEFIPEGGLSGGLRRLSGRRDGLADPAWASHRPRFEHRPDLLAILRWSIDASSVARFRDETGEFREAAVGWLSETAGNTAAAVFRCIEANQRADALPIGLAAGVVYSARRGASSIRPRGRWRSVPRRIGPGRGDHRALECRGRGGHPPPDHGPSREEEPAPAGR